MQLDENIQLAEKVYFKTGIISPEDKETILNITGGDNYTKIVCDLVAWERKVNFKMGEVMWKRFYEAVKTYNRTVLPIAGFNSIYEFDIESIGEFFYEALSRKDCVDRLKMLPGIAIRNLKEDIKKPRNDMEFRYLKRQLDTIRSFLASINRLGEEREQQLLPKIFTSSRKTFDEIINFAEESQHLLFNNFSDKSELYDIVESLEGEAEVIQDDGDLMVIDVMSPAAMKAVGCNSTWCFSLPGGESYWSEYSYNGHVYFISDFDDESNQYVLTHPSEVGLYDITNDNVEDGYEHLVRMGVDISKLTFGGSDEAEKLIQKYQESPMVSEIRKIVREVIKEILGE